MSLELPEFEVSGLGNYEFAITIYKEDHIVTSYVTKKDVKIFWELLNEINLSEKCFLAVNFKNVSNFNLLNKFPHVAEAIFNYIAKKFMGIPFVSFWLTLDTEKEYVLHVSENEEFFSDF